MGEASRPSAMIWACVTVWVWSQPSSFVVQGLWLEISNKSMWADILLVVFLRRTIAPYFFISLFRSWHGRPHKPLPAYTYIYLSLGSNVLFPKTDFSVSPTIPVVLISLLRFCLICETLGISARLPAISPNHWKPSKLSQYHLYDGFNYFYFPSPT